ncbi:RimK family alpha-L-glutamate ligase [Candidatus Woesearchaeota archaeon]|jgi:ribosomal protein S6--L-glutamate ligase|nr:RimK family alpha-L-glutamate ligase [Candidatus Woesearchaeota archaeon]MBT3538122.1 RimK family alpha-L-glutamate ligase [Candidatus Woesearchaeota archaeon]MBT4697519.1 RimK family alpha-L-glutamate ligase [Candidatus Woesearchaeota archaeon]MBT4717366.1 RimK family alpha-L-glutamate ligase [Candidatus Woesearchaeota archaeon]MBT7105791.1 RimK family alpha-L-glutamate ligase [Candidatus Woesearchaeota archaeon]
MAAEEPKLRAALVSLGSVSSKWTLEEMEKYFSEVDSLNVKEFEVDLGSDGAEVLYKGKKIPDYDCIYLKGSFKYANLLSSICSVLQGKCYMPTSPSSFTNGHDKLLTHLKMQQAKIPMPATYISSTPQAGKEILERMNYPIIIKFPQGTHGKGVLIAESYTSASSMLDALIALKQPFIIQEFVDTGGKDIRAIVVGNKVVAAMQRVAKKGEHRANVHAGGVCEAIVVDYKTEKIAVETAKRLGIDICAVDILLGPKGPLVIEANLSPGLQGITDCTKINVASKIARFLYEQTLIFKQNKGDNKTNRILNDLGIGKSTPAQEIVSNLDFRGTRILLPEMASALSKLSTADEVTISAKKDEIKIKKMDIE